ncbi:MAG: C10 family peptidase [Bacteroidota bacterium]
MGAALGSNYSCDETGGVAMSYINNVLTGTYGYSNASYTSSYNLSIVKSNIQNYKPVIIGGARGIFDGGHAWVIEGLKEYFIYKCSWVEGEWRGQKVRTPTTSSGFVWNLFEGYTKLYMNWGFGSQYDGWFSSSPDFWDPRGAGPYDYNHEMIYNITP